MFFDKTPRIVITNQHSNFDLMINHLEVLQTILLRAILVIGVKCLFIGNSVEESNYFPMRPENIFQIVSSSNLLISFSKGPEVQRYVISMQNAYQSY